MAKGVLTLVIIWVLCPGNGLEERIRISIVLYT